MSESVPVSERWRGRCGSVNVYVWAHTTVIREPNCNQTSRQFNRNLMTCHDTSLILFSWKCLTKSFWLRAEGWRVCSFFLPPSETWELLLLLLDFFLWTSCCFPAIDSPRIIAFEADILKQSILTTIKIFTVNPWCRNPVHQPELRIWIRDPVLFLPLDPGKVFPGSRILNPYYWSFSDNFLGKKYLSNWGYLFKNEMLNFVATKKVRKLNCFPFSFCCCWILYPGWIKLSGSGLNILDPQHCSQHIPGKNGDLTGSNFVPKVS